MKNPGICPGCSGSGVSYDTGRAADCPLCAPSQGEPQQSAVPLCCNRLMLPGWAPTPFWECGVCKRKMDLQGKAVE